MKTKCQIEEIRKYAHPVAVSDEINGSKRPWDEGYQIATSSNAIKKAKRTYGDLCKKFGKKAVDKAIDAGAIMVADAKNNRQRFDFSQCVDSTPITANGVGVG